MDACKAVYFKFVSESKRLQLGDAFLAQLSNEECGVQLPYLQGHNAPCYLKILTFPLYKAFLNFL